MMAPGEQRAVDAVVTAVPAPPAAVAGTGVTVVRGDEVGAWAAGMRLKMRIDETRHVEAEVGY